MKESAILCRKYIHQKDQIPTKLTPFINSLLGYLLRITPSTTCIAANTVSLLTKDITFVHFNEK